MAGNNTKMNISFRIRAIDAFSKNMKKMERQLDSLSRKAEKVGEMEKIKIDVDGDASSIARLQALEEKLDSVNKKSDIDIRVRGGNANIDVDTRGVTTAMAKLELLRKQADRIDKKIVLTTVVTGMGVWSDLRNRMDKIAEFSRDVGQVIQSQIFSMILVLAPAAAGAIGSLGAVIGALGPIVGTVVGQTMSLASAFFGAGAGGVALAALAVPALQAVFDGSENLTASQQKAKDATDNLKESFNGIANAAAPEILSAYTSVMNTLHYLLKGLAPMFESVTKAASNLADALAINVEYDDFVAFIDYLNNTAGPMFETIAKAAGNFIMGLINMLVAFNPLAQETATSFLNLSQRFREWTASLGESQKFNAFMDYVRENGPKVSSIIGGLITGLVDMFAAFAPFAADMMDGLLGITERFKEWAATLSENQQFQEWIDYVKSHGPEILSLIGELKDFLINLGIGFAEVSETITPLITKLFEWANVLMENHSWVAQLAGWISVLGGVIGLLIPPVSLVYSLFNRIIAPIWRWLNGNQLLSASLKVAGKSVLGMIAKLLRFLGPVGLIISIVFELARVIFENWDAIAAWTSETWSKIVSWTTEKWNQAKEAVVVAAKLIYQWAKQKFLDAYNAVKDFVSQTLSTIKEKWSNAKTAVITAVRLIYNNVKNWFSNAYNSVKTFMSNIWSTIQNLWSRAKTFVVTTVSGIYSSVASWFSNIFTSVSGFMSNIFSTISNLWNQAKTTTSDIVSNIWTTVSDKFSEIVSAVAEKMGEVWTNIQEIWGEVMDFLGGIDLFSIGQNIIEGLIGGIKDMGKSLIEAATGVVDDAIQGAKNLLGINSPSKLFIQFGKWTGEGFTIGLDKMARSVKKTSEQMTGAATPKNNPVKQFRDQFQTKQSDVVLRNDKSADNEADLHARDMQDKNSALLTEILNELRRSRQVNVQVEGDSDVIRARVNEGNALAELGRYF